jgi:hypothetical protein
MAREWVGMWWLHDVREHLWLFVVELSRCAEEA